MKHIVRKIFLNSKFIDYDNAFVHIDDRGLQFADGIYEVMLLKDNKLIDMQWHIERLFNSLTAIGINLTYTSVQITEICLQLAQLNSITDGMLYMQITRGTTPRNLLITDDLSPTVIITITPLTPSTSIINGIRVMTLEDIRWHRCDIKSTNLLASALSLRKAHDCGYDDAIFIRNNIITEATAANVFLVTNDNILVTKKLDNLILGGITRKRVLHLANELKITNKEEDFSLDELLKAKEIFITSSTKLIRPVFAVNNTIINNNKCGEITMSLIKAYNEFIDLQ
jgi:D-alanine transaminase